MSNIKLVIQREYMSRVKKKSFLVMTFAGPILLASLFVGAIWIAISETQDQNVIVVDDTGFFQEMKGLGEDLEFTYLPELNLDQAKAVLRSNEDYTSLVWFPANMIDAQTQPRLFFQKQPGVVTMRRMEHHFETLLERAIMQAENIDPEVYYRVKRNVHMVSTKVQDDGQESQVDTTAAAIGFGFSVAIYIFIFMYGVMVMRGVIEEKTSRIVEVIISSVRPFQLMMGKIIGIAMVGLTQFLLWVILTSVLISIGTAFVADSMLDSALTQGQLTEEMMQEMSGEIDDMKALQEQEVMQALIRTNWGTMAFVFLLYFLGGYLLYASMFAAVGAAVDQETETQQFMLPITAPMIFGFVVAEMSLLNPDSAAIVWLSHVPFTSPVVMMVRVAMAESGGVPLAAWELPLSLVTLFGTFIGTTWLAGRIYRTGILMYGKKTSWKELWKWIRYS